MIRALLIVGSIGLGVSPASALCIYGGVDNAKTTVAQELRDSKWVVRARIVSADYHWSDEGESWTLYRLRVVETYKGRIQPRFAVFTERNSGGFYMDGDGGVPDLDRDYLLFLVPDPWPKNRPPAAKGALSINYSCGQSKPWSEVSSLEKRALAMVSGGG